MEKDVTDKVQTLRISTTEDRRTRRERKRKKFDDYVTEGIIKFLLIVEVNNKILFLSSNFVTEIIKLLINRFRKILNKYTV